MYWLEGKKTYITAVIMGLTAMAKSLGWLTPETSQTIELYLLPFALGFLRAGVTKSGPVS